MIFAILYALLANVFRLFLAPLVLWRRARAAPEGAFVQLVIDGGVVAMAPPRSRLPWAPKPSGQPLDRVRELVDALLADPRPAGLLVTVKSLGTSAAMRTMLRDQLVRVRAAGRPLVVHLPFGGSTSELFLASAASRVLMGVETSFSPLGFRSERLHFRRALDRAGLLPGVHAAGAYKSAGEPLMRDTMSPEAAEQSGRLLDVVYEELIEALVSGRALSREAAVSAVDLGMLSAATAVELRLVDSVSHDDEVLHLLQAQRAEKPQRVTSATRYLRRRTARVFRRLVPRPRIAVVELHGAILERSPFGAGNVCEAHRVVPALDSLSENPFVAAVVLHVDSPGGGVLASEKIHRAVARLAAKKPVVACFGGVAASGGYYVSAPTACIVAAPTTITGSIGVVAARVLVGPLLERLGITPQTLVRGARADMLSPFHDFDEGERATFDEEIDRAYRRFVALVAEGRHRSEDEIRALAGGRVWAGVDAHAHGLVDRLGTLDVALDEARRRASSPHAEPVLISLRPAGSPLSLSRLLSAVSLRSLEAVGLGPAATAAQVSLSQGGRERVWALAFLDRWLG